MPAIVTRVRPAAPQGSSPFSAQLIASESYQRLEMDITASVITSYNRARQVAAKVYETVDLRV